MSMRELLRPRLPRLLLAVALGVLSLGSALALAGISAWLITRAWQMPPVLDLAVAVVAVRALGISRELKTTAEAAIRANIPVVAVDRRLRTASVDTVLVDNQHGAREATEHLLGEGARRIAVVLGEADPGAETKRAREAIRRPMTRWLSMDDNERKRKIHQYLVTRGFSYDVIEEVLARPAAADE